MEARVQPWQLDQDSEALCALGDFKGALRALQLSRQLEKHPAEYTDRACDYYAVKVFIGLGKQGEAVKIIKRMESESGYTPGYIPGLKDLLTLDTVAEDSALAISQRQIDLWTNGNGPEFQNLQFVARLMEKSNHPKAANLILDKIEELRGK